VIPAAAGTVPGSSPVPAPALGADPPNATLVPREGALPPGRAPFSPRFELRCADVHPVRCDEALRSSSPRELVARACAHGASAHGFTPAWYSPERVAAMAGAVTERLS
jgi:hypothetical protein